MDTYDSRDLTSLLCDSRHESSSNRSANPSACSCVPCRHYVGAGPTGCPDRPLTRAHLAAFLYRSRTATFSGTGDRVTDDIILEPGYYDIWIAFRVKPGYDWDDRESYDLYTRFKSKTDGLQHILQAGTAYGWPLRLSRINFSKSVKR